MTSVNNPLSKGHKIALALFTPLILLGFGLSFYRAYNFYAALRDNAENVFISTRTFTIVAIGIYALMLIGVIAYGVMAKPAAAQDGLPKTMGQKISYGLLTYGTLFFFGLAFFSPFLPKLITQHYGYTLCLRDANYAAGAGGYSYVIYSKTDAACAALTATGKPPLSLEQQVNPRTAPEKQP